MAVDDPAIESAWPAKDIAYTSIVGLIMLAAFFEWSLWLLSFLYGLMKVYQKAENTSTKVLAVINAVAFTLLRLVFLPVMVFTLPLPHAIVRTFPETLVSVLQWFAFWTFSGLLIVPWLICIWQTITHSVGTDPRVKELLIDEFNAPKVVIVMPCYNEEPEILLRTVESIVNCDYPDECMHIFLSFDGDQENELYLNTIQKLGVPMVRRTGFPTSIDIPYLDRVRITVSRFPHGGKRSCQKRTFKLINKIYEEYLAANDDVFCLFIDSDCILDKVCIQNFMYEMELKDGGKGKMMAMTGVITATSEKTTLLSLIQDMEYVHGQLFERAVESACGAVTCLPGALTMLRFSAFQKVAKHYFADKAEQCDDLFDYCKCHLGEDRWLTHLFMIAADSRYQIGMATSSFIKTESVATMKSLLKQRRRWFLGFLTNEVCMLCDIRLWRRMPDLLIIRFAQGTIRTTSLLFFIMVISLMTTSQRIENLPVGFIAVSLGLNWILMAFFSFILPRYKLLLYPLLFVVAPFFNWLYMVYGIFTAGQRTWGGPRADAVEADAKITPQTAIEHAEAAGDDLNVIPETFRSAAALRRGHPYLAPRVPLQPSESLEGRFGENRALTTSMAFSDEEIGSSLMRSRTVPHISLHPRLSMDSVGTASSANYSIRMPQHAQSIRPEETLRTLRPKSRLHPPSASSAYFSVQLDSRRDSRTSSIESLDLASTAHRWSSPNLTSGIPLVDFPPPPKMHDRYDRSSMPMSGIYSRGPSPLRRSLTPISDLRLAAAATSAPDLTARSASIVPNRIAAESEGWQPMMQASVDYVGGRDNGEIETDQARTQSLVAEVNCDTRSASENNRGDGARKHKKLKKLLKKCSPKSSKKGKPARSDPPPRPPRPE